jgi:lipoate-protein ligase A
MNMAVDEALLLSAPRSGPTLRFYQWQEPTLSLGYFQGASERSSHEASADCPIVRRSTGGGAIVHDQELTYSFVVPVSSQDKAVAQPLYYAFHETLVLALELWDVKATLFPAEPLVQTGQAEPFLCFQRRAPGDVILGKEKICGSAQRRQKDALLQHGSVLLGRSSFAPELGGIKDLAASDITCDRLTELWIPLLEKRLELRFCSADLNPPECAAAERLAEDRFGADSWSLRR